MRNYEAMIVLDTKGKEESVDQLISGVTKEFEKAGAKLEQVDNLGRKTFPFSPRHVEAGFFINIQMKAEPAAVKAAKARLTLNDAVYQQYYLVR
jgi:small subunit ribosomal protein S6